MGSNQKPETGPGEAFLGIGTDRSRKQHLPPQYIGRGIIMAGSKMESGLAAKLLSAIQDADMSYKAFRPNKLTEWQLFHHMSEAYDQAVAICEDSNSMLVDFRANMDHRCFDATIQPPKAASHIRLDVKITHLTSLNSTSIIGMHSNGKDKV